MISWITDFFSRSSEAIRRSSALAPLLWVIYVVCFVLIVCLIYKVNIKIVVTWIIVTAVLLLVFIVSYLILLLRNTDALRSEWFLLERMKISREYLGDDIQGLSKPKEVGNRKAISDNSEDEQ